MAGGIPTRQKKIQEQLDDHEKRISQLEDVSVEDKVLGAGRDARLDLLDECSRIHERRLNNADHAIRRIQRRVAARDKDKAGRRKH